MGSPCEIRLFAPDGALAARVVSAAAAEVERLEARYSRYRPGNFLDRVNTAAAAGASVAVDEEFHALLEYADTCYALSDGLFDITSGVLRKAWRFDRPQLPDPGTVEHLLEHLGWEHLSWDRQRLSFARKGMELDFGGLVKEYAADRAAAVCLEQGIRHGTVDLGGDIRIIGPMPGGEPWLINVRHPRRAGEDMATLALSEGALASSGDYERRLEINAQVYCHILSPKTGWPVQGLAGVSVVADQCVVAGSSCTIAMLKEREGVPWLEELGLPNLWMDMAGRHGGSPGKGGCVIDWHIQ
jgi:thiamine biosynthesis lipoprotein